MKNKQSTPNLSPKHLLASLQPQIETLARACISIQTKEGQSLQLASSKFGGLPFYPSTEALPKDDKGKTLRFLAQLNFSEIPHLSLFPQQGLLQFFIAEDDDLYGLDFDTPTNQNGFRVLFFEDLDFEPRRDWKEIYVEAWEYSPLQKAPLALTFTQKKDYPSYPSLEYYQDIQPLFEQIENGDYLDFLEDLYMDQQTAKGHKIGGTPYFTQNEIRESQDQFSDYQLLLQMDSDRDKIMWGDVGVANFFIKKEDLIN